MTKNNWREEFDNHFLRVGTKAFLGIDNKEVGESMAIQIKDFIEQVEANAKREAYEEVVDYVDSFINGGTEESYANYLISMPRLIQLKFITPPTDDKE